MARFLTSRATLGFIAFLATFGGGYFLWAAAQTPTPGEAFRRGEEQLKRGELQEAEQLFVIASRSEELRDWSSVMLGGIAEQQNLLQKAEKLYQQVSEKSAASLDAQVALLRVSRLLAKLPANDPPSAPSVSLHGIEATLVRNRREDLVDDLLFELAKQEENSGKVALAAISLSNIRKRFPGSPVAGEARKSLEHLRAKNPELFNDEPVASLLTEARLLLQEGEAVQALEKTQLAHSKVPPESPAAMEVLLAQEEVLRRLKRGEEALHTLHEIASREFPGSADPALLKLAKSAWNKEDPLRALELLKRLSDRFSGSDHLPDALYTQGRILEELKRFPEAEKSYQTILTLFDQKLSFDRESDRAENHLQAVKRLAWISLLNREKSGAAQRFSELRRLALDEMERLRVLIAPELFREEELSPSAKTARRAFLSALDYARHATYWEAFSLGTDPRANSLLLGLKESDTVGYYGFLARAALLSHAGTSVGEGERHPVIGGSCDLADFSSTPLRARIHALRAFSLGGLIEREIDWAFGDGGVFPQPKSVLEHLRSTVTKLRFLSEGERYRRAITVAEEKLGELATLSSLPPELEPCRAALREISYPLPNRELFQRSSRDIAPALLYAIARTESAFDPRAVSPVGAQGLVQLMPTTAKSEGLLSTEDIFDPAVNLRLGAKHLARLIRDFDGSLPFAIAAYNAGSAPVKRWRERYGAIPVEQWGERIGYPETNRYVKKVLVAEQRYRALLESSREKSDSTSSRS